MRKFGWNIGEALTVETIIGLAIEPFLANLLADFDVQLWGDCNQAEIEELVKV